MSPSYKQGGFGPLEGALLDGLAAPLISNVAGPLLSTMSKAFGGGARPTSGAELRLAGTTGTGMRLHGTVSRGKKVVWTDQLAEELHKPIKHRFPTRRVIVGGVDDTWSADLVDMQSFSKYNDGVKYLLNVIEEFSMYMWSIPLHDKMGKTIREAFDTINDT